MLTITATVVSPAAQTNTGTISDADQFDPNTANNTASATVIAAPDMPGVAQNDAFTTAENAVLNGVSNVFADNGSGPDSDPDDPLQVTAVNGNALNVGTTITLASGALLTLNANGTFSYDPNGAFDALPTPASGASNTPGTDSFTYTITGSSTATVTVTITGVDSDDTLIGTGRHRQPQRRHRQRPLFRREQRRRSERGRRRRLRHRGRSRRLHACRPTSRRSTSSAPA